MRSLILFSFMITAGDCLGQSSFSCGESFQAELERPAGVYWSEIPLRDGLKSLSASRKVAFWLDRRLDPTRRIKFAAGSQALHECLQQLATQAVLDISWFECIVYVGPSTAANRLATVDMVHREQLAKLPVPIRHRWQHRVAKKWEKLATPQSLLEELEAEVGVRITGLDRVPHDLWPAISLPPLPAYVRLELILSGFDLTFTFGGDGAATIVPMPSKPVFRKRYRVPPVREKEFSEAVASHAGINYQGETADVRADWATHDWVRRMLSKTMQPRPAGATRYTLRGKNQPVGPLIEQLCEQLRLTCEFSEIAQRKFGERITFEVVQADRDTLFATILGLATLQHQLTQDHLRVFAVEEAKGERESP